MAAGNRTLGRFDLVGIPPAPRGIPQIEVTFDIDRNGIVHVSAKDKATGKEQKIRIESSSGLSKEEIDKMMNEAKAHEGEDKKKRELVDARNQLDTLVYTVEKSLKDYGDKGSADEKKKVEAALSKAKTKLSSDDVNEIKTAQEELTKASHKIAEEMYKEASEKQKAQSQATGSHQAGADKGKKSAEGGPASGGQGKSDEDIVDADYKVEDEDK